MTRWGLACVAVAASLVSCGADPPTAPVGISVDGCRPGVAALGSGVVLRDGLVLTSAHVLRGARSITVISRDRSTGATIVAFDPDMDLAYLRPDVALPGSFDLADDTGSIARGAPGTAYVMRDGTITAVPVRVQRPVRIHTEDIYIDGDTYREGWELEADIRTGDSGGAVVVDGEVIGVVWSRSRVAANRAYAIDPVRAGGRVREQLRTGRLGDVDLTRCS